ncbi:hypothetical protein F1559_004782 [Cyanidiococcus yangmingshanensis]|uniref:Gluconeogenesis factor n=1 Tax=Cyanidiococcus yangmingshanensis TaxID=2690220 RepID=A0A7J7IQJ1_9RHOD|nr:hypothetical protein F1559_004782 [Cyanidiococcus yangmingshanensis]
MTLGLDGPSPVRSVANNLSLGSKRCKKRSLKSAAVLAVQTTRTRVAGVTTPNEPFPTMKLHKQASHNPIDSELAPLLFMQTTSLPIRISGHEDDMCLYRRVRSNPNSMRYGSTRSLDVKSQSPTPETACRWQIGRPLIIKHFQVVARRRASRFGGFSFWRMQDERSTVTPPRVVVLGGGTGMHCVLHGMVYWSRVHMPLDITGIVCTSDDGGSTGRIRDELGMPAPGDIRNALEGICSALELSARSLSGVQRGTSDQMRSSRHAGSVSETAWWQLLGHRLGRGRFTEPQATSAKRETLVGHAFGNLLLAALYEMHGAQWSRAVQAACEMLGIPRNLCRLWPVSNDLLQLVGEKAVSVSEAPVAATDSRQTIVGESSFAASPGRLLRIRVQRQPRDGPFSIDTSDDDDQSRVSPVACPEALKAIQNADAIILGPGSLYTSIAAVVAIPSVREALYRWSSATNPARAPIYVCNLWTEPGETDGMDVSAHIDALCATLTPRDASSTSVHPQIPLRVLVDASQLIEAHPEEANTPSINRERAKAETSTKAQLVTLLHSVGSPSLMDHAFCTVSIHVDRVRLEDESTTTTDVAPSKDKLPGHDPHRLTRALLRMFLQRHQGSSMFPTKRSA